MGRLSAIILLALSAISASADIIPSERRVVWQGNAGVEGGIPTRPVWGQAPGIVAGGTTDNTAAIQAALINAAPDTAVTLPAGTFLQNGVVTLQSHKVLRGSGTNTILKLNGRLDTGAGAGYFAVPVAWTGGYAKGATSITVANASGLAVGMMVGLDQLNDTSFVNIVGFEGPYLASGRTGANLWLGSPRAMPQIVKITSVSGNTIGIDPPLLLEHKSSLSPELFTFGGTPSSWIGIENMLIDCTGSASDWQIDFTVANNCWVKNVEFIKPNRAAVISRYGFRNEVRDCYVHDYRVIGSTAYGFELLDSSSCWIENNIISKIVAAVMVGGGNAGNIVSHNFVPEPTPGWLYGSIFGVHAVHSYMNLFEGNILPSIYIDRIHGSGSHNLALRNRMYGWSSVSTGNLRAYSAEGWNRTNSVIGNYLGTSGIHNVYQNAIGTPWTAGNEIYFLGWDNVNGSMIWQNGVQVVGPGNDQNTVDSLYRHGNYDTKTGTIIWDPSNADHTIPDSLVYSSKPAWWGNAVWPAVGPTGANKNPAQLRYEGGGIVNPPPAGQIVWSQATYTTTETTPTVILNAIRTGGSSGIFTANFATANGSAVAGHDYSSTSGQVYFPDGAAGPIPVTVQILNSGDTATTNRTFNVNMTGGTVGSPSSATVIIQMTAPPPAPVGTVAFSPTSYSTAEATQSVTLTVTRSGGSGGAITVNYATVNGTALAGRDFVSKSGTLSWGSGDASSKTITVSQINSGDTSSSPRTFTLTLSNPTGGTSITSATATVSIAMDPPIVRLGGTLSFVSATYSAGETNGPVTISVVRTGGTNQNVSVNYATANDTALSGLDYTATSGTLSWGDNSTKTFTVPILNSQSVGNNRSFTISLSSPTGGSTIGTGTTTVSITMNATPGGLRWALTNYSTTEASTKVTLLAQRYNGVAGTATVDYTTVDGTALAGRDYVASSGTLTWTQGDASQKLVDVLQINSGDTSSTPRTFTVVLSNPSSGAVLGTATATVNIAMNPPVIGVGGTISLSASSYTTSETSGGVTISVARSGGSNQQVTVSYGTANSTATAGFDYLQTSGSITWAANDNSTKTLVVPILNSQTIGPDRVFLVNLSGPTGGAVLGTSSGTVSIQMNAGVEVQIIFKSGTIYSGRIGGPGQ